LQNIANHVRSGQPVTVPEELQVADMDAYQGSAPIASAIGPLGALQAARQARREAELAGCEMEELTAALHSKPPVGRWPRLARASFGPSVAVLSG
jgi:hypothetical protein